MMRKILGLWMISLSVAYHASAGENTSLPPAIEFPDGSLIVLDTADVVNQLVHECLLGGHENYQDHSPELLNTIKNPELNVANPRPGTQSMQKLSDYNKEKYPEGSGRRQDIIPFFNDPSNFDQSNTLALMQEAEASSDNDTSRLYTEQRQFVCVLDVFETINNDKYILGPDDKEKVKKTLELLKHIQDTINNALKITAGAYADEIKGDISNVASMILSSANRFASSFDNQSDLASFSPVLTVPILLNILKDAIAGTFSVSTISGTTPYATSSFFKTLGPAALLVATIDYLSTLGVVVSLEPVWALHQEAYNYLESIGFGEVAMLDTLERNSWLNANKLAPDDIVKIGKDIEIEKVLDYIRNISNPGCVSKLEQCYIRKEDLQEAARRSNQNRRFDIPNFFDKPEFQPQYCIIPCFFTCLIQSQNQVSEPWPHQIAGCNLLDK